MQPRDLHDRGGDRHGGGEIDPLPLEGNEEQDERQVIDQKLHNPLFYHASVRSGIRRPAGRKRRARSAAAPEASPSAARARGAGRAAPGRTRGPDRSCARARCRCGRRCRRSDSGGRAPARAAPASCTAPPRRARRPRPRARRRSRSRCSARVPSTPTRRHATRDRCTTRTGRARRRAGSGNAPTRAATRSSRSTDAGARIEPIGEQAHDAVAAEFARRQRNSVEHEQRDLGRRPDAHRDWASGPAARDSRIRVRRSRGGFAEVRSPWKISRSGENTSRLRRPCRHRINSISGCSGRCGASGDLRGAPTPFCTTLALCCRAATD